MARIEKFTFNNKDFEMEPKQKLFCMYYVKNGFNGQQAAIAAGYSKKTATSQASRMLAQANLAGYVEALKEDIAFCLGISAVDIARQYQRLGFNNIKKVFDDHGNLVQVHEIPDDEAQAISSVEVFEVSDGKGNKLGDVRKVKFHDKISALDKLAKMIGKDGVTKTAAVNARGEDVTPPATNIIMIDPKSLTTEQLEKLIEKNGG